MIKRSILVILAVLAMLLVPLLAQADEAIYEHYDENDDVDYDNYGLIMSAQSFTAESTHNVSRIDVEIGRVGTPYYVRLELQECTTDTEADADPSGVALAYAIVTYSYLTTEADGGWVQFDLSETVQLQQGQMYAIVLSAPAGDAAAYAFWNYDDAGATFTGGRKLVSTNGGETWTDTADEDFQFRVYGETDCSIESVRIFNSVKETDDWLICVYYINRAAPYYDDGDIAQLFRLQLVDAGNTSDILAQSVLRQWDAAPASIYINANTASVLQWGGNYTVQIQATYGGNWTVPQVLDSTHWGSDMMQDLDRWVLSSAQGMENVNEADYLDKSAVTRTDVLNPDGMVLFETGIPGLGSIRGEYIYQLYTEAGMPSSTTSSGAMQGDYQWDVQLGPEIAGNLTALGGVVHLGGDEIGFIIIMFLMTCVVVGSVPLGHFSEGMAAGSLILLAGIVAGLVQVIWLALVLVIILALVLKRFWLERT